MVVLVAIAGRMEVGTLGADGVILVVETEVVEVDCSSDRVGQDSVWILTQAHAAVDGGPVAESDTFLHCAEESGGVSLNLLIIISMNSNCNMRSERLQHICYQQ